MSSSLWHMHRRSRGWGWMEFHNRRLPEQYVMLSLKNTFSFEKIVLHLMLVYKSLKVRSTICLSCVNWCRALKELSSWSRVLCASATMSFLDKAADSQHSSILIESAALSLMPDHCNRQDHPSYANDGSFTKSVRSPSIDIDCNVAFDAVNVSKFCGKQLCLLESLCALSHSTFISRSSSKNLSPVMLRQIALVS